MNDIIDMGSYVKFMGALAFVLGLILMATWVVKRFGLVQGVPQNRLRKDRRIKIIESQMLDTRRRVVLLQHDDTEHLVLLGPNNDVVLGAPRPSSPFAEVLDPPTTRHAIEDAKDGQETPA